MKTGDHLVVSRLGYTHHGLYVGDGSVIHYSGLASGFSSGAIESIDLESFADGGEVSVRHYTRRKYSRQASVERALSRLGEDAYNVLLNNCEHFVTWCITGQHSSQQVNSAVAGAASVSGALPLTQALVRTAPSLMCDQAGPVAARLAAGEIGKTAATSLAKSVSPAAASALAGMTTSLGTASTTGLVAAVSTLGLASVSATVFTPLAVGVGAYYGVKKIFDWFGD